MIYSESQLFGGLVHTDCGALLKSKSCNNSSFPLAPHQKFFGFLHIIISDFQGEGNKDKDVPLCTIKLQKSLSIICPVVKICPESRGGNIHFISQWENCQSHIVKSTCGREDNVASLFGKKISHKFSFHR